MFSVSESINVGVQFNLLPAQTSARSTHPAQLPPLTHLAPRTAAPFQPHCRSTVTVPRLLGITLRPKFRRSAHLPSPSLLLTCSLPSRIHAHAMCASSTFYLCSYRVKTLLPSQRHYTCAIPSCNETTLLYAPSTRRQAWPLGVLLRAPTLILRLQILRAPRPRRGGAQRSHTHTPTPTPTGSQCKCISSTRTRTRALSVKEPAAAHQLGRQRHRSVRGTAKAYPLASTAKPHLPQGSAVAN